MQDIPDCQDHGDNLSGNSRDSGPHHAPLENEDEDRIKNNIEYRARQGGCHGKAGTSVRTDDRIQRLPEHVERDAQRNVKEILFGMFKSFCIYSPAEHGDDLVAEKQVKQRQDQTADDDHQDRITDTPFRPLRLFHTQAQTHKGTASVPDHDCDRQSDHCEWEDHRVGCVSVRSQISGIGNKDLVYDVIEGPDQQGYDAGDRVLSHQSAYRLLSKKMICVCFHKIFTSFQCNKKSNV